MKRLNVKLLLILLVTIVVLSTGVAVVHAIQVNRNADSLIKRADEAKAKGDTTQAIWYYRRYLSNKPQDLERFAEFAMLISKVAETPGATPQDYGGALKALQSVLDTDRGRSEGKLNDKNRAEIRRKLIDLEMGTHQSQLLAAARRQLQEMKTKGESTPKDDLNLAKCQIGLGNYADAAKVLESLIGYNPETKTFDAKATMPEEVDAYLTLATLLRERVTDTEVSDRNDIADQVMDQLTTANPDSAKARLGKAKYLQQYYTRDKGKPELEKALQLAPNDPDVLLQAADMAMQAKDFAQAETLLKKGIEQHPKDDRLYLCLALIAKAQKNNKLEKERLEAGLVEASTSTTLLQMLFDLQIEERDAKAAHTTLEKLEATNYPPILKEYRETQLLMLEGNLLEASRRLEKLRPQLAKATDNVRQSDYVMQADYMLMQCYQLLKLPDLALGAARRLVAANPNVIEAQLGIAASLMALGKTEESKAEYEKLLSAMELTNQKTAVPQVCNALVQLRITEQMRLPAESRDWQSVKSYINDLVQRGLVGEPVTGLMQADVLAHAGDNEGAAKILDQLIQQFPDNPVVRGARVEVALQEHKPDEAMKLIDAMPQGAKDVLTFELSKIDAILLRDQKRDEMLKQLADLSAQANKEKLPEIKLARIHNGLAMAYLRLGEPDKALAEWKMAGDLQPNDAQIRWSMFDLMRETPNPTGLKDLVDWFSAQYGRDSAQAKLAEAGMLVSGVRDDLRSRAANGQLELSATNKEQLLKARDMLRVVESLRPDWHQRPKILSEIDYLENKPDEAIVDLREALRLGPPDPAQVRRLAQLLMMQKRYAEVKEVLDTYGSASNKGLERIEAVNDQFIGRPDKALQHLESVIPKDSQNPGDHLYHGQLLASAGKTDEAEAELRKATELGPQQSETWLSLAYFLVTNNKMDEARKTIQQAQIELPEDRRTLAVAQGYEMLGDGQMADQFFKTALDASPNDPKTQRVVAGYYLRHKEYDLAKPLITTLLAIKPKTGSDKEILLWARRSQAQMLAAEGGYPNFVKAMEYLAPLPGEKATATDLSMRAFMLGTRSDVESAGEGLKALLELKELRTLGMDERMLMAQMYERTGNWSAARDEMLALLNQPNPTASMYVQFIEMLLRRNAPNEAGPWLQKLEAFSKSSPLLVATVAAHVAQIQGNGAAATARMMRLVPTERPLPKDKAETLRMVADLLGQLEQYDQAEKLWREYVELNPQKSLDLATFLAKRGKVDEALQLSEQRRKTEPPVTILKIAAAAAKQRVHPLTAEQAKRIEEMFQRALRDDPDSVSVQILWGDFLDSQGRYDDLEKVYRAILARKDISDKNRAGVANNLAFTLAVQGKELDDALKLSEDTIAFLGPVSEALDTRGIVYLAKGNTRQAIRDLTDAVSVVDPQAVTYAHLAMAQAAAHDISAARQSLDKAKELKIDTGELSPLDKKKYDALVEQLANPT